MSTLPARNRVIYQSEALFISPDTTGNHVYFKPSFTGNGNITDCLVTGSRDGAEAVLDVCKGTLAVGGETEVWSNVTLPCYTGFYTGNKNGQDDLSPILNVVGMTGVITANPSAMLHQMLFQRY